VGNKKLMDDHGIAAGELASAISEMEGRGETVVLLALDGTLVAAIGLLDTPKEHCREVMEKLKAMGLEIYMLTGDTERAAKTIAAELGIEHVLADLSPEEKGGQDKGTPGDRESSGHGR